MPTLKINGRDLEYEPGETVIQVAHRGGIEIPHYCYHPSLEPEGNCRICMVEVEGWPKPVVSCKQLCADNMVVQTESDLAQSARAGTMEMLLVNHPLDCPICDQAGECHLQEYSYELGQGESRSTTPKTHLPKNVPFGDGIVYDAERCIKCTLCVRFCNDIVGTGELSMANRSDNEQVIMTSKGEFTTRYSMNIVDLCPVGALTSRDFRFKSRLWFMDFTPSICTGCARGCNVTIGGRGGRFMRMEPRENQAVNRWWMCDPGRLGYGHANSATRLVTPAVRDAAGAWQPTMWEDAIVAAAAVLKDAPGAGDILVDGGATLEEFDVARGLAAALGGQARFAAAVGDDADDLLIVDEKGANARGAEMLGLARQTEPAAATILFVERDTNVGQALRDGTGAGVAFVTDAAHVPDSVRVAFPLGSWAERDGLLVNTDGLIQAQRRAREVGPDSMLAAFSVLEELHGELVADYVPRGRDDVLAALAAEPAFADAVFPERRTAAQTVGAGS